MISCRVAENMRGYLKALEIFTSLLKTSAGFGQKSGSICVYLWVCHDSLCGVLLCKLFDYLWEGTVGKSVSMNVRIPSSCLIEPMEGKVSVRHVVVAD